jgi:hypothetical protein
MRTVVDTAPRCRGPAHAGQGTDRERFDQEPLAIGTGLTGVKERSARSRGLVPLMRKRESRRPCLREESLIERFCQRSASPFTPAAIAASAQAGIPKLNACFRCSACRRGRRSDGRRTDARGTLCAAGAVLA